MKRTIEDLPAEDGPPDVQRAAVIEQRAPSPDSAPVQIIHREPLVERAEWKDPADTGTAARMHGARTIEGWRRVWTIQQLHRSSPREITAAHVKAAERLLGDYELGILGATQSGATNDRVDGGSHAGISGARLDAMRRYRDAMTVIGSSAALIVCKIVLDNWTVTRLAEQLGTQRHRAFGRLQAGLERLREYYWPPEDNAAVRAVQPLVGLVIDPEVTDLDQERLGRWRRPMAVAERC